MVAVVAVVVAGGTSSCTFPSGGGGLVVVVEVSWRPAWWVAVVEGRWAGPRLLLLLSSNTCIGGGRQARSVGIGTTVMVKAWANAGQVIEGKGAKG